MGRTALARRPRSGERRGVLFTIVALVPLAAMLAALFAAVWLRTS
jgi:hypothetical protein